VDGLFEDIVAEVATEYRNVEHSQELFDALLAKLIMHPERYDVIVCPNEYGDFLSDAVYGLIGSIGLGASASYAFTRSHQPLIGIFDPAGGTAPDIAGKGIANPSGAIEAYGYLLEFCGHFDMGKRLVDAVHDSIASGEKTGDLGGTLNTRQFTESVIRRVIPEVRGVTRGRASHTDVRKSSYLVRIPRVRSGKRRRGRVVPKLLQSVPWFVAAPAVVVAAAVFAGASYYFTGPLFHETCANERNLLTGEFEASNCGEGADVARRPTTQEPTRPLDGGWRFGR
jgi:hypothetical protein